MSSEETPKRKSSLGWILCAAAMVVVFLLGMLAASINERKAEVASIYNNKKIELTQTNAKNGDWGLNYPREYETWKMTEKGDFKSKYNGNDEHDVLADRPNMVILWAGYAFSQDYTKPRGHMHAIEDMRRTLRTGAPMDGKGEMQPGTCWTCKSPDVPRYMAEHGIAEFYAKKWSELGNEIVNPIGCADCHDAKTMNLRVSRPALIEAFKRQGKDINNATQQEMRSLVCAQCHEEYYFKKGTNYLTFPFDKGQTVEAIEQYYDEQGFTDYVHKLSKTPILKAQHPGWSMFLQGPHGQHGVACADCHMPYKAEGGIKYSDHQIMSPLAKISSTCQTCHRESEENLRNWANENLRKGEEVRTVAEEALAKDHIMAKACWDAGATEEEMPPILKLIRQSQWRWDYAVASHGAAFHAPAEFQRIMSHSIEKAYQAQVLLQKVMIAHNVNFTMPDVSTKEKAQAYIGLNMAEKKAAKDKFLQTVVPQWVEEAKKAGRL